MEWDELVVSLAAQRPKVPEESSKDIFRVTRAKPIVHLLVRSHEGTVFFFDDKTNETLWARWFEHKNMGLLLLAFYSAFLLAVPVVSRRNFHISAFEACDQWFTGFYLWCMRCHQTTFVDQSWFDRLQFEPEMLLCCHGRMLYRPYWSLFFWGIKTYNALAPFLTENGYHPLLVAPAGKKLQFSNAANLFSSRRFVQSGIQFSKTTNMTAS